VCVRVFVRVRFASINPNQSVRTFRGIVVHFQKDYITTFRSPRHKTLSANLPPPIDRRVSQTVLNVQCRLKLKRLPADEPPERLPASEVSLSVCVRARARLSRPYRRTSLPKIDGKAPRKLNPCRVHHSEAIHRAGTPISARGRAFAHQAAAALSAAAPSRCSFPCRAGIDGPGGAGPRPGGRGWLRARCASESHCVRVRPDCRFRSCVRVASESGSGCAALQVLGCRNH
jgi:hypothetical protein